MIRQGLVLILGSLVVAGCDFDGFGPDTVAPSMPRGVFASAGDNVVEVFWDPVPDLDVAEYRIYVSDRYNGRYEFIGSTSGTSFSDFGAGNGQTYYYGVSAVDYSGNESALGLGEGMAVARPEIYNVRLLSVRVNQAMAGFGFAAGEVLPWDLVATDVYYDYDQGVPYMVAYGDIRDMGPTRDLRDVPIAPGGGWAPTREVILRRGHTYVVWTEDNNFAKFRVIDLLSDRVVFDCAYQLQAGNPLLKRGAGRSERSSALRSR
jgi:hypothetical protein